MTEPDYSKRDYNKKFYWSADKKDLRKSFSKKTMVIWSIIYLLIGIGLIWYSNIVISFWNNFLVLGGMISLFLSYVHLSYIWGGKIWGANKK
jgi:hypothetical protein